MSRNEQRTRAIAETIKVDPSMTYGEAATLYDLGSHAFNEARAAMHRVAETAPEDLRRAIVISAMATFVTMMRELAPEEFAAVLTAPDNDGTNAAVIVLGHAQ